MSFLGFYLYRKGLCGDCSCGVDLNDPCAECPKGKWREVGCKSLCPAEVPPPPPVQRPIPDSPPRQPDEERTKLFHRLWKLLHETAARDGIDVKFIREFNRQIPCGECRLHWLMLLQARMPPGTGQYQWSVDIHNAVNKRLGKPIFVPV